jgi:hypothetical protein
MFDIDISLTVDKGTNKREQYKINLYLFLLSSESTFGEAKGTKK